MLAGRLDLVSTTGDLERENLPWAIAEAGYLARQHRGHEDLRPDLEQEALLGFVAACRRYREGPVPFRAYAQRRMSGQMADHLRAVDPHTRSDRRIVRELQAEGSDRQAERGDGSPIMRTVHIDARRPYDERDGDPAIQLVAPVLEPRDQAVRDAVARLPLRERIVLYLVYWVGISHAEVAEILGVSAGTVTLERQAAERRLRRGLLDVAA